MSEFCWGWVAVDDGVCGVVADDRLIYRSYYLLDQRELRRRVGQDYPSAKQEDGPLLSQALSQLTEYFAGRRTVFDLPLAQTSLTSFAQNVHEALCRIPYGEVVTYAELGRQAGSPRAARAVGRIMATNPFPVIVPCHRVVRADGRLGEYSAARGPSTKRRLIEGERQSRSAPYLSGKPVQNDQRGAE